MKDKKAQAQIITVVLIILLVLAAIVIVWQVLQQELNPKVEFEIIEKINCVNGLLYGCNQGCWFALVEDYNYLNETQQKIVEPCIELCGQVYYEDETCEFIEVDEIVLKIYNVSSYEYCKTIGYDSLGIPNGYGCVKIIPKNKLKIEWLNENCEILRTQTKYISEPTIVQRDALRELVNPTSGIGSVYECSKYFVGVKDR